MIKRYRLQPSVWMTRTIMVQTPNHCVSRARQQKSIVCLKVTTHPFFFFFFSFFFFFKSSSETCYLLYLHSLISVKFTEETFIYDTTALDVAPH